MTLKGGWNPYDSDAWREPYDMSDYDPVDWGRELVERAEAGDIDATRILFTDLALALAGRPTVENLVGDSPEARAFLGARLMKAMDAKQADVGKALGLRLPSPKNRASKWGSYKADFVDWYVRRTQELGFTGREVWYDKWEDEVKEVDAWIAAKDIAPDEKTVIDWRRAGRDQLNRIWMSTEA